jgi:uncharacterized membrane protein YgaE (UPF0421/DUF939 family)
MTALIVVRPDIQGTTHKGLARLLGTMVGAALATLIRKTLCRPLSYPRAWY